MSNWDSPSGRKSPKWRGVSLTKMKDAQGRINDGHVALRVAQRAMAEGTVQLKKEIAELFTKTGYTIIQPEHIALGWHECSESPTLHCLYDNSEDPSHDECIVCGSPSDRK